MTELDFVEALQARLLHPPPSMHELEVEIARERMNARRLEICLDALMLRLDAAEVALNRLICLRLADAMEALLEEDRTP